MNVPQYDLVIRGGRVVTQGRVEMSDVGVCDGRIARIAPQLGAGKREIDANGHWVLPGGIDSHCHVEQRSGMGMMCADDFYSATVSAAFGGTTTIIPFAAQHRNASIPEVLADYHARAAEKAVIDYGFHLIVANPDEETMQTDLPQAIRDGITSLKVYMTYEKMRLDDYQLLDILALARHEQALVMLHAENHDMIRWITQRLLEQGHTAPKFHGVAHDPIAESEATNRAIAMSRLLDVPVMIVHVAGAETVQLLRGAQRLGARVLAESCPQYLFLDAKDMDRPGLEGAMFCCSPPARDAASQQEVWRGLLDGTLATYSSDHAPYRFDASGKLPNGDATTFKEMANGVPGIELRMPLLFSEGVMTGRMDIHQFVALTAGNHAALYGLSGRKGELVAGADADIAIWDPERRTTIKASMLHDNTGYTPYEGRTMQGWPTTVINRGRVVVQDGQLLVERGTGQFLRRSKPELPNASAANTAATHVRGSVLKALLEVRGPQ
ncbi:dihydropyrimidinase [Corticibacter populi]|uniref:Dihydropyrimidinase n=1 Tax=Corticibacter populi TaxID=1550736 RepID=A0A3M6QS19_9BURK|nr:dihydropyrimidinase [Corticibacter populi]RMX05826.1 dihydropyrimidinase [Corticibacter populi]RZS30860.1 dihydropyrimidinase [Corticibacter populi]